MTHYRQTARRIVEEYAGHKPSVGEVDSYPMIDPDGDHYIAMQSGWVNGHRAHGAFIHLDIIGGKVWIQFDGTDRPVADELEAAGIPKEDIVLGEQPPDVRHLTGYGVG
ncbi:MAG: XisI protein [Gemmataceae bacterium]|nr:XisI protein [Gemmataceae bacterium]